MCSQEAALAQAEQTLPPLEKALGLNRDLLTALTGQYSNDEIIEKFELGSLQLPHALPVSLPSALVQHRPDIRAAQANLNSASALIGVATANRLPLVSLTAQTGSSAANLANLFVPATAFYALGGNVTQTIFDAGTLLHKQKQAEAEFDQAYAQYRSTVIGAFQNVADALRAIEADAPRGKGREGLGSRCGQEPRGRPQAARIRPNQHHCSAQRSADLYAGNARSRSGESRPLFRHRRPLPSPRRRLVEPPPARRRNLVSRAYRSRPGSVF
jgi:hypothetical protein